MSPPSTPSRSVRFPLALGVHLGFAAAFLATVTTSRGLAGPVVWGSALSVAAIVTLLARSRPTLPRRYLRSSLRPLAFAWPLLAGLAALLSAHERGLAAIAIALGAFLAAAAVEATAASELLSTCRSEDGVLAEWEARPPRRWTWTIRLAGVAALAAWLGTVLFVDLDALATALPVAGATAEDLLVVATGGLVGAATTGLLTAGRSRRFVLTGETLFVREANAVNWRTVPVDRVRGVDRTGDALDAVGVLSLGVPPGGAAPDSTVGLALGVGLLQFVVVGVAFVPGQSSASPLVRSREDAAMPALDEQLGQASSRPSSSANTVRKRRETWASQLSQCGMSRV